MFRHECLSADLVVEWVYILCSLLFFIFIWFFFFFFIFFFFQAEDGIRDLYVTGVQTCALPISRCGRRAPRRPLHRDNRRTGAGRPGGAFLVATGLPERQDCRNTARHEPAGRHDDGVNALRRPSTAVNALLDRKSVV